MSLLRFDDADLVGSAGVDLADDCDVSAGQPAGSLGCPHGQAAQELSSQQQQLNPDENFPWSKFSGIFFSIVRMGSGNSQQYFGLSS